MTVGGVVFESLLESEDVARIRSRNDDTALTHSDVHARRPLVDAGVDYSASEVENLRSTRPEVGGALDLDLGDTFRSQRRTPAIWDHVHKEQESRREIQARKAAIFGKYGDGGFLDKNSGATPAEQVRIAQEAEDRMDADPGQSRLDVPASRYREVEQNQWVQAKIAARGEQQQQLEMSGADMFERHAVAQQEERRGAEAIAEAEYQTANRGVPAGFSASRPAPAVPAIKGARSRRIKEAADNGSGAEPTTSELRTARKGLLAGMSKGDRSAWRRMENQQKLPRRVGFSQEKSLGFDWTDKPEQVAADLASDDAARAVPRSMLDRALRISPSTNEGTRSIAKPSPLEDDREAMRQRESELNARADANAPIRHHQLQQYVNLLNPRERRDSAYVNDYSPDGGVDFGHSNEGMAGLNRDYMRAEIKAAQGGEGAREARETMDIISSSHPDEGNKERQALALGYGDAGRGMVSYDVGSSQYFGPSRRRQALNSQEGPTQGGIVERANARRGIFSRMFDSIARWLPGMGKLFGQAPDTRFAAAPGQEANRINAKKAATRKRRDQRASSMFSMARLFGTTPRTRPQVSAAPQGASTNIAASQPNFASPSRSDIAPALIDNRNSTEPVGPELEAIDDGGSMQQFGSDSQVGGSDGGEYGLAPELIDNDPKPRQDDPRFNVDDDGGGMNYVSPYDQALEAWEQRRARR